MLAVVALMQWVRPADSSIAVIPFSTRTTDPDMAYLSQGISEGLISTLAQLPDVKVIARSSSFRFSNDGLDVPAVAKTLGVRTLVTGRIAAEGSRIRITTELVSGRDSTVIWGAEYTPTLANLADVQAQIASAIAQRIASRLAKPVQQKLLKAATTDADAYALLLRGRYQMSLYNPASTRRAAEYFEQALGIDPRSAWANAELANTYRRLGGAGILNPQTALPLAESAAGKAVAADGTLAEAHAVLADVKKDLWQWDAAEREYAQALQISPSLASAREGLAICLSLRGRHEQALAEITRARQLDPIGLSNTIDTAAVFYNVRRYAHALDTLKRALILDGTAPALWTWVGIVNGGSGNFPDAIAAFEKAFQLGDQTPATQSYYVYALARLGRKEEARRLLESIAGSKEFVPRSSLAIAYTGLGEIERALALLEQAYREGDPLLQYLMVEPHFDPLRQDARFQRIASEMGVNR